MATGYWAPRPRNRVWCFSANSSATFSTVLSMARASPRWVGRRRSPSTNPASMPAARVPRTWPRDRVSSIRPTSWVVKALVEATPISGPAWVSRVRSDSRTSELVPTLQMARLVR
ncbi:hypothetical protein D3C78_1174700 [compost metagenome]